MTTTEDLEELQMYIAESREHLATIESDLLDMEAGGEVIDEKLVNKVFRAAHSIKGGAGFFGLKKIQELGHKVENVLDMIRSRKMTPNSEIINLLLLSFDCLREMVNDHAASHQVDISDLVMALNGLTTSFLPSREKESVKKMREIKTPGGRIAFSVPEFDMQRAQEREEYVYLIEIDLIHDIQQRGKSPWDVFKNYIACGSLMECDLNFEAVGTLDEDFVDNRIPLDLLFASIIDPSFIHSLFEDISPEKITTIQGPAHPQALLGASPGSQETEEAEQTDTAPLTSMVAQKSKAVTPAAGKQPAPEKEKKISETSPDLIAVQDSSPAPLIEETLRVNVNLLENLMNLASEMVLSRNQLQNAIEGGDMESIRTSGQNVSLTTSELQETIMLTRMQPIGNILNKFSRVVRDLAQQHDKSITLEIYGKDVEIDKSLLEGLSEPLTHMVRNAVDHGIETPDEREAQGKNRTGRVTLRAYHAAGQVVLEIADDGRGIDPQKVGRSALKKGLISEDRLKLMSDGEKQALIFLAGLSTAEKVSDVSGRGVGMDVVKTNLDRLGGKVDISSQPGKGTTFRITLPLTLAIIPSLLVSVKNDRFAIPQINISELIHISASQVKDRLEVVGDAEVLVLREKLVPIVRLADILGVKRSYEDPQTGEFKPDRRERISDRRSKHSDPFLRPDELASAVTNNDRRINSDRRFHAASDLEIAIINTGTLEYGLVVDALHDTFEIVVRPLGQHLKQCSIYTGASVLGDGKVALILDASGIAARARLSALTNSARARQLQEEENLNRQKERLTLLLFHNAPDENCAVPLEKVERIEQIQKRQVERTAGRRSMHYRGGSLPLVCLQDSANLKDFDEKAEQVVIVMSRQGRLFGLLAAQPVDVVEEALLIDAATHRQPGIAGSCILNQATTLLVDDDELARAVLGIAAPAPPPTAATAASGGQTAVILLAEDSSFFRGKISKYLEDEGYRVLAAEDGQAALALLRQHAAEVNLVVTDIEMPLMNGLELTRAIKADPALEHLPVVALTTLADDGDIAAGEAAGVNAYEIKLDKDKLLQTVRQMVQG